MNRNEGSTYENSGELNDKPSDYSGDGRCISVLTGIGGANEGGMSIPIETAVKHNEANMKNKVQHERKKYMENQF